MAGLWDQIGGFLGDVGDVAQKITEVGEQVSASWATLAGLKSGSAVGTPPFLGGLPPGYGPIVVGPPGNNPNPSSMGAQAIKDRIASRAAQRTLLVGGGIVLAVVLLSGKS